MRLHYSLNAVFFQAIGLPMDIIVLLRTIYKIALQPTRMVLTSEEKRVLCAFVDSYPETVKKKFTVSEHFH